MTRQAPAESGNPSLGNWVFVEPPLSRRLVSEPVCRSRPPIIFLLLLFCFLFCSKWGILSSPNLPTSQAPFLKCSTEHFSSTWKGGIWRRIPCVIRRLVSTMVVGEMTLEKGWDFVLASCLLSFLESVVSKWWISQHNLSVLVVVNYSVFGIFVILSVLIFYTYTLVHQSQYN